MTTLHDVISGTLSPAEWEALLDQADAAIAQRRARVETDGRFIADIRESYARHGVAMPLSERAMSWVWDVAHNRRGRG